MATTIGRTKLTVKQEKFVNNYFQLGNATKAAIITGYAPKYCGTNADKLLKNTKIQARLNELQAISRGNSILNVGQRKQLLSKIASTILLPEQITPDHTIRAIAELNKMEHVYETGTVINMNDISFHVGKGYSDSPGGTPLLEDKTIDGSSDVAKA
jgi:phage terminase small subunit